MHCSDLKIHVFYKSVSGTDISTMDLENSEVKNIKVKECLWQGIAGVDIQMRDFSPGKLVLKFIHLVQREER